MLFNAPIFLFGFLPIVLAGTALLGGLRQGRLAAAWLALASLVFYGWDQPKRLLPIILASIAFNYLVSRRIAASRSRHWLWLGVGGNLALLGVFKYAGFATTTLAALGLPVTEARVALPIGISFYSFTQIAYLVDTYRREAAPQGVVNYTLFVTLFPHLIAGPILHHRDIMPQLSRPGSYRVRLDDLAVGMSWFAAGMFKKVMLADGIAPYANAVFDAAARGAAPSGAAAWQGALAYALQLYFDFAGYSDMAIGLALMLGLRFPLNFLSPYQATSLIDFWRRWHITLSAFLRDYVYIPLGGNRHGKTKRLLNLFITTLLGGFWHGAGFNFLLWGALHGAGLAANHAWRERGWRLPPLLAQGLTLLLVVLAWVPFRAHTLAVAMRLWGAMLEPGGTAPAAGWLWVAALGAVALVAPNTAQIFGWAPAPRYTRWRPALGTALLLGAGLGMAVAGSIDKPTAFLYFRF